MPVKFRNERERRQAEIRIRRRAQQERLVRLVFADRLKRAA